MQVSQIHQQEQYPGLWRLDYGKRWLEGLVSVLEGYLMTFSSILLTVGISLSMYDFLTGGSALGNPIMFNSWAIIQTAAIDAQFISTWYRLKIAIAERNAWKILAYLLLGIMLAFVTFGASAIPALQKALNIPYDSAVIQLGLDPALMVYARSGVAIILAIIGAFQRTIVYFDKTGKVSVDTSAVPVVSPVQNTQNWWNGLRQKISFPWQKKVDQTMPKEPDKTEEEPVQMNPVFEEKDEPEDSGFSLDFDQNTVGAFAENSSVPELQESHVEDRETPGEIQVVNMPQSEQKTERITRELSPLEEAKSQDEITGYTQEEVVNDDRVKMLFKRLDTRKKAVEEAINSKVLPLRKGRVSETGLKAWVQSVKRSRESAPKQVKERA